MNQTQAGMTEFAILPPDDDHSYFQWDRVVLNLPTTQGWGPSLPWVMLMKKNGELTSALVRYVDNNHQTDRVL